MQDTRILDDAKVRMLIAAYLPPDDGNPYVTIHVPLDLAEELAKYQDCYAPLLSAVAVRCAKELG